MSAFRNGRRVSSTFTAFVADAWRISMIGYDSGKSVLERFYAELTINNFENAVTAHYQTSGMVAT